MVILLTLFREVSSLVEDHSDEYKKGIYGKKKFESMPLQRPTVLKEDEEKVQVSPTKVQPNREKVQPKKVKSERYSKESKSKIMEKVLMLKANGVFMRDIPSIVKIPRSTIFFWLKDAKEELIWEIGGIEQPKSVGLENRITLIEEKSVPGSIVKCGEYGEVLDARLIPIPYQLFFARYGFLPKHLFPIKKGELKYSSYHLVSVLHLLSGEVVYSYDSFLGAKGCHLVGEVSKINCGSENGNLKFDDFLLLGKDYKISQVLENEGDILELLGFHVTSLEELSEDMEEGSLSFDDIQKVNLSEAFDQMAPRVVGNDEVKEILTYSVVRRDKREPRRSSVPVVVFANSGEGKTYLLDDLQRIFGADMYRAEDLTPAALGMVDPSTGEIRYTGLSDIILIDEIDKAQARTVSLLLEVAGLEVGHRVRYGIKFTKETGSLLFSTFLLSSKLGIFDEEKGGSWGRVGNIHRQYLRRNVILRLEQESEDLDNELVDKVLEGTGEEENYKYITLELSKLLCLSKLFLMTCQFKIKDIEKVKEIYKEIRGFGFAETTNWYRTLYRSVKLLAEGRALCHGVERVDVDKKIIWVLPEDFKRVMEILKKHALSLNFYKGEIVHEPEVEPLGEMTIVEFDEEKLKRVETPFFEKCSYCGENKLISYFYDSNPICDTCRKDMGMS